MRQALVVFENVLIILTTILLLLLAYYSASRRLIGRDWRLRNVAGRNEVRGHIQRFTRLIITLHRRLHQRRRLGWNIITITVTTTTTTIANFIRVINVRGMI